MHLRWVNILWVGFSPISERGTIFVNCVWLLRSSWKWDYVKKGKCASSVVGELFCLNDFSLTSIQISEKNKHQTYFVECAYRAALKDQKYHDTVPNLSETWTSLFLHYTVANDSMSGRRRPLLDFSDTLDNIGLRWLHKLTHAVLSGTTKLV